MPEQHPDRSANDAAALDRIALSAFNETATPSYRRGDCAVFRKTNERFGGLSNMAAGFPLWVNGIEIRTAEAIYQAARFPHLPEVQRAILDQAGPMGAKMKAKPYRGVSRPDFDARRVSIMWWALRVKLACNPTTFARLLAATGTRPIVEDSHRDRYWGAVPSPHDREVLCGANVLGRLLMVLRKVVDDVDPQAWRVVPPPPLGGFTLLGHAIGVVDGARVPRSRGVSSAVGGRKPITADTSKGRVLRAVCPSCNIVLPASCGCDNCD